MKQCPNCGHNRAVCPECGKLFEHGEAAHCDEESCKAVNAPLDCEDCGLVVSDDLTGVLDYDLNLLKYI